jgi:hypothetical protein
VPLVIGGASSVFCAAQRNWRGTFPGFKPLFRRFIPGFPVSAHQSCISGASPDFLLFAQIMVPIAAICQESDAKNAG